GDAVECCCAAGDDGVEGFDARVFGLRPPAGVRLGLGEPLALPVVPFDEVVVAASECDAQAVRDYLRGHTRTGKRRADDDVPSVAQRGHGIPGLLFAGLVQGNVTCALQAPCGVPVGLAVADKGDG